jgi:hypothetical protein
VARKYGYHVSDVAVRSGQRVAEHQYPVSRYAVFGADEKAGASLCVRRISGRANRRWHRRKHSILDITGRDRSGRPRNNGASDIGSYRSSAPVPNLRRMPPVRVVECRKTLWKPARSSIRVMPTTPMPTRLVRPRRLPRRLRHNTMMTYPRRAHWLRPRR